MCIRLIVVPAGNPCSVAVKDDVAAVMFPAASLVNTMVKTPVPLPDASPPCTALTSFDGDKAAVNVGLVGVVGVVGDESLLQPAAKTQSAAQMTDTCFIGCSLRRTFSTG